MADIPPLIMLVDDNRTNLMAGKVSLSDDYTVLTVSSAKKMFELLDRHKPEVILLDVLMPEMNGFEAMRLLRERPDTRDIPVIFLTALSDTDKELEGISLGGSDYIMKPFSPPLLRQRISLHVELARLRRMARVGSGGPPGPLSGTPARGAGASAEPPDRAADIPPSPQAGAQAVEAPAPASMPDPLGGAAWDIGLGGFPSDGEALFSLLRTQRAVISALAGRADWLTPEAEAAAAVAAAAGRGAVYAIFEEAHRSGIWPEETERWDQNVLGPSSLLHDIGKLYVPEGIILKPGRLTPAEIRLVRRHVELGTAFIARISEHQGAADYLRYAKILAGYHHERWDGRGYPYGLRGADIPLLGRIMAVADVYDALTSPRPYRSAMEHVAAVRIIREGSGTAFDPAVVGLFEKAMG
ncbi:MAG: response regulator [Deltaproteobacteria bacterium]|jgi:putative two-component system response regulator|nr:response regulator [Deltaproteobacteria bacterium]